MKTLNKKETEIQNTLARLRVDNPPSLPATGVTATEKKARSEISRQRVSAGLKKVKTVDRQAVIHAIIHDIMLGAISQGEALKKLRVEVLGLRQDEYARLVDVSRKTLSDVENDKGNYSAEIINKIYKPFGLETGLVPISKTLISSLFK
ncbi:helix-turn-helix transcriptional regulator [Klebsiella variicola]|uniref:helix-turn-helix transcriptional regulator n=1 Tax=Klebsiella variicola TaxID=244366 RepID=UPI000541ACF7|nr:MULTISPECIES: helix-turn-helix transcriptional regulator [Klebsiella]KAA0466050.1 helix-turn-helix transcriptional regulator [Klebsiella variicola]KHE26013.1 XRE family transcriptional regulator [Klebsiella variicola]MBD0760385.1 helix-turn-helix transcriptional regulator [Klebsiella variicola]MBQ5057628.1 helix-turn-helix transcriptional regulator [Klebsiella variicola]MCD9769317.1 helix-turn-helix domain-containing protein [Klebsiella variicola subsp. variicola]